MKWYPKSLTYWVWVWGFFFWFHNLLPFLKTVKEKKSNSGKSFTVILLILKLTKPYIIFFTRPILNIIHANTTNLLLAGLKHD